MSLSRVKVWTTETLYASDLNAEFNNILNFLNASEINAVDSLSPNNDDIIQRKAGAWDTRSLAEYAADLVAAVPTLIAPLVATVQDPQGRLTLTTLTPVLISDVTSATSVFYTPYLGSLVPIYNGTYFVPTQFAELTLALDNASGHTGYHQSGKLFDLFVVNDGGTIRLGTGPAWTSSSARGTGAGTTELEMVQGLYVNKNALAALRFGSVSGNTLAVAARSATYVGTFYATGDGMTKMVFAPSSANGGTANVLGLWNAYNRVVQSAIGRDKTTTWNYSTNTYQQVNASSSNNISVVQGLPGALLSVRYEAQADNGAGSAVATIAISLDGTTTPDVRGNVGHSDLPGTSAEAQLLAFLDVNNAAIGLIAAIPLEKGNGSATTRWYGSTASTSGGTLLTRSEQ